MTEIMSDQIMSDQIMSDQQDGMGQRREVTRRRFIGEASCAAVGSTALFSTALNLQLNAKAAAAALQPGDDYKAIVCVLLAGGNDSYNMLVPTDTFTYAQYADVRSNLSLLPRDPGGGYDGDPMRGPIRDLNFDDDGRTFGVHPAFAEIQQLFNQGALAFIANVGTMIEPLTVAQYKNKSRQLPRALFSHSDQVAHWQTAYPQGSRSDGWGGRISDVIGDLNLGGQVSMNISLNGNNVFQSGISTSHYTITQNGSIAIRGKDNSPTSLAGRRYGAIGSTAADANTFSGQTYANLFEQAYLAELTNSVATDALFADSFDNADLATNFDASSALARRLEAVAKTIKARSALGMRRQVFFVTAGGWDNHQELLVNHNGLLGDVSRSVKSFWDALAEPGVDATDDVVLFTTSDFGRTLRSNGRGTDHAWGGHQFVLGGPVVGGQIYGQYPTDSELEINGGLDVSRNGRMLPTTSVDEYAAEIARWFGVPNAMLDTVLPNVRNFVDSGVDRPIGFLQDSDDPTDPSGVTFSQSCLDNNGRFDILLVNGGPQTATFDIDITGLDRRSRTLSVGEQINVPVTGRPDRSYDIVVYRDGQLLDQTTFDVTCDRPLSEVVVEHSCLNDDGRIDVWLQNDTGASATYDVSVSGLTARRTVLAPGATSRTTFTGRQDGLYTVGVIRNGASIHSEIVTIGCDVQTEPVVVTNSCLAGMGRLDFDLFNDTPGPATFAIDVGTLARRSRSVPAGGTTRVTYTGRRNGPLPVIVRRNNVIVHESSQQIDC